MTESRRPTLRELWLGVGRAFGGSLLFALPILMTMEMWHFGAVLPPRRIAVFVGITLPLLVALARSLGFRDTPGMSWGDHIADAFVGYAVGVATAAGVLAVFGLLSDEYSRGEIVGMIAIESVPTSIGAVIARGQFGASPEGGQAIGYTGEILLMAVGAGVFAFNVAPTEEVPRIAAVAGPVRMMVLACITIGMMHAMVYVVGFRGEHRSAAPGWSVFLGFTVVGYATALLVSLYLLWVFARTADATVAMLASQVVVLGLPAGLGAAAARLVL